MTIKVVHFGVWSKVQARKLSRTLMNLEHAFQVRSQLVELLKVRQILKPQGGLCLCTLRTCPIFHHAQTVKGLQTFTNTIRPLLPKKRTEPP